jgi:hypothetical protein
MMERHFLSEIQAFKLKMLFISSMKREEEENKTKDKEAGGSWPISCRYLMQQVDNTQG